MLLDRLKKRQLYQQQQGSSQGQSSVTGGASSANQQQQQQQEQEVDVTEDIEKLLNYVAKKKEDDPHDTVLSRIHSRMKDIVEKLVGDTPPGDAHNQPPTTPTVTIPDLPQWKFVRKRGGRIVKRPVQKQEVTK